MAPAPTQSPSVRADRRRLDRLGAGANKLTLANTANSGTVKNVATLIGGSGTDAMTLGMALVNGSVDLGAGNDTLQLNQSPTGFP